MGLFLKLFRGKYQLEKFYKGLEQLGITCSETQMGQFLTFYEMLIEKNKVMNLTSITEWEDAVEKHFLDSLSLIKCMDLNKKIRDGRRVSGYSFEDSIS